MTQKIDLKNIDKSGWEPHQFEAIAKRIAESVDPNTTDLGVYVGLEHIDADNIHINRFGTPSDVSGGKLKCYPGDVIFGKRRAYQRKAAVVDFEGICSAHAFVFRANPKVIDPNLFPFFLHSDQFMHRMVDISVGGLSPTINWGDLKHQEFLLPPKDQQAQLAELLWAMDEVVEREGIVLMALKSSYQILADDLFTKPNDNFNYVRLDRIATINEENLKSGADPNYRFRYLDIAGITEPKVIGELKEMAFSEAPSRAKRIVQNNSTVLSMVRPYQLSFVFVENGEGIIASTGTSVVNANNKEYARFLFHQFFSKKFIRFCEDRMSGTNYPAITPSDLEQFKVAIPKNQVEVEKMTNRLNSFDKAIDKMKTQIACSKALQKSLINQIF